MATKFEIAARKAGWKTADLTPNAAVNEASTNPDGTCAFFQVPEGYDLWENLCIAENIAVED